MKSSRAIALGVAALGAVAAHDVIQRKHAILRNYPVIGHLRFLLERFGPELRQYIVTSNDEERPFSRDQRRWVYASSKLENSYFGFGTDNDVENVVGYPIIKHRTFAGPGRRHPPACRGGRAAAVREGGGLRREAGREPSGRPRWSTSRA